MLRSVLDSIRLLLVAVARRTPTEYHRLPRLAPSRVCEGIPAAKGWCASAAGGAIRYTYSSEYDRERRPSPQMEETK